jgi:hypothetical protein
MDGAERNQLVLWRETTLLLEQAEFALSKTPEVQNAGFAQRLGPGQTFERAVIDAHTKVAAVLALGQKQIRQVPRSES